VGERRLRILHVVCGEYERGGMQKHVLDLTGAQAAMGDVAALLAHPTFGDHVAPGVRLVSMDTERSRRDRAFRAEVSDAIREFAPDVVHAHAGKAAKIVASLMPLSCASIATVHGLKRSLRAPAKFDRVIAVSEFAAKRLPRDKARVVYNGVDVRDYASTPPGASLASFFDGDESVPVAIAVGRLARVKGFDTAIRAWRLIEDARLLIVGEGPERARLEGLVDRFGLRGRVAFAGARADGASLIARAAMLVAPSHREGFGYVVVEALLARVPVVTTMTSGAAPVLPNDTLVRPRDARSLARVARRTLGDRAGALAAFEPVFARATREFTLEGMVERTRNVYLEAVGVASSQGAANQV
jgi:glycosyltransferase involved in cell wall biosynthesis